MSPNLAAGRPLIKLLKEPVAMVLIDKLQYHISPTHAAGKPLIVAMKAPGPMIGPPT